MEDRFNTIAGWVLFAGIVALGTSIVAGEAMHSERPEKMGYPIAGVEEESTDGAAAEKPIEAYLATADAAKGADTFKKCAACHNADKGGANQMGPNLWDVLGEPIGQGKGFAFSDALSKKGGKWNWDELGQWLKSPKAFATGTKMSFAGLGKPEDRANVILFMLQNGGGPALPPLPAADAAAAAGDAAAGPATEPGADAAGAVAQEQPADTGAAAAPGAVRMMISGIGPPSGIGGSSNRSAGASQRA